MDDVFELTYGKFTNGMDASGDISPSDHTKQKASKSSYMSKSREEDAKVLYQISYLLNKKGQKNNKKNNNSSMDEDRNGSDSESSGFVSLDNGIKASTGCETRDIFTSDLTEGEREAFLSEGYPILNRGPPCTKSEERALKRIRRKIKNKLSAQESRRKKKEYVESLEKRVEYVNSENGILREQVDSLNNTVRSLLKELKRIQGATTRPKISRGTQSGTCLKCYLKKTSSTEAPPEKE